MDVEFHSKKKNEGLKVQISISNLKIGHSGAEIHKIVQMQ